MAITIITLILIIVGIIAGLFFSRNFCQGEVIQLLEIPQALHGFVQYAEGNPGVTTYRVYGKKYKYCYIYFNTNYEPQNLSYVCNGNFLTDLEIHWENNTGKLATPLQLYCVKMPRRIYIDNIILFENDTRVNQYSYNANQTE